MEKDINFEFKECMNLLMRREQELQEMYKTLEDRENRIAELESAILNAFTERYAEKKGGEGNGSEGADDSEAGRQVETL